MIICTFAVPMYRLRLMKGRCLLLVLLPLILLAACDDGARQRLQLEELERMNRADSLMTNDSLALDLAEWFDDYGSPNEQLRAHYILGRTYADLGEAPQAIEAYNDAIERADTTSQNCDFRTLCRVYSQKAIIFYRQNLLDDNLRCLDKSIYYAYKANDTMAAINSYGQKLGAYDKRHLSDSVIAISTETYRRFNHVGFPETGSRYLSYAVNGYTEKGDLDKARHYMSIYESKSGYFDSLGNIEQGREAYYDIKGKYYLACGRLDSAEYFFKKELREGHTFNNQNMASYWLAKLFQMTGKPDSAAKYALYSYVMNDSTYAQVTTEAVVQMQASYDYTSQQHIAQREKERADSEKQKTRILFCTIVGIILIGIYIAYRLIQHQKAERTAYMAIVDELERTQNDVLQLRSHETELDEMLREKESKMEDLKKELAKFRLPIRSITKDSAEDRLKESLVYQNLHAKADKGELLLCEDWHELNRLVITTLPEFHQLLSSKTHNLGINEYRATVLLRLHIKPKSVSCLLGCSPQNITKLSKQVLAKLFNVEGSSKELAKIVMEIS